MSLTSSELLQLRWNSYETNFHLAFSEIRDNNKFHDVTIATPDGHVHAHRVLLSAFSPVLARILDVDPHPHPLLYIHGININHITTILDFMYKGEAHISQDTMDEFLAAAEELKVTGLSETRNDSQELSETRNDSQELSETSRDSQKQAKESDNASQSEAKNTISSAEDVIEDNPEQTTEVSEENSTEKAKDNPTVKKSTPAVLTTCLIKELTLEKAMKDQELQTVKVRTPQSINNTCFEEIVIDDDDDDEVVNDTENLANESLKNTQDTKKELKRKKESDKRIENAIDSVIRQSVTPKVRKISSNENSSQGLVDSDGAPILNPESEDGEVQVFGEVQVKNDDSFEVVLGDGIDWDQKEILTKSVADKARFRAIVDAMITKRNSDPSCREEDGFMCLMCGKEFPGNQANPKKNAVSHCDHNHTDHILHKCHICDLIVKTSDALTRHIGKFHKNKDKEEVYDYIPVN